jgi:hypothetical protein
MSDETDGVLGNLPRSRPGVRSDKRAAASKPRPAKPRSPRATKPPPPPPPPPASDDPLAAAVKAAGQVAETGIKVAARVAGGVLRRLPRP